MSLLLRLLSGDQTLGATVEPASIQVGLTKVQRGQQITQAQMNALAIEATAKIGKPYIFPVPVIWQVQSRANMLTFDLADWGVTPGGIVIVKDERKVYQLTNLQGARPWETFENWTELTNWHLVDRVFGVFANPYSNLANLSNAAVLDFAAVVADSQGTLRVSPTVFRLWPSPPPPSSTEPVFPTGNWHLLGGGVETPPGFGLAQQLGIGRGMWREELRTIQTGCIAKISDALSRPQKSYIHGQRPIPFATFSPARNPVVSNAALGLPDVDRNVLQVTRVGAPLGTLPQVEGNINYIRMFKEAAGYCRGASEVWIHCIATGIINWKQGGVVNGDRGSPSGPLFDFHTIDEQDVNYLARDVRFTVTVRCQLLQGFPQDMVFSFTDSTGQGQREDAPGTQHLTGGILGTGGQWKPWTGGIFDVSATVDGANVVLSDNTSVSYTVEYRVKCQVNSGTTARHKTAEARRGRIPDIAVLAPAFATTPLGNRIEVGHITWVCAMGDTLGAFVAKPAATIPIFAGELKGYTPLPGLASDGALVVVPYPVYKWTGTPVANPERWSLGVDAPGNGMVFDLFVSRPDAGAATFVDIGVNRSGAFALQIRVNIPAGQKGARATIGQLSQFVLMDNEPLYFRESGVAISTVQVMAIPRMGAPGGFDSHGAQVPFADDYNATVDFLNDI